MLPIPIIGGLLDRLFGVIDKAVPDKDQAARLKADLQAQAMQLDYSEVENEINNRVKVIVAEAQGESWLQRNWRPLLMLTFTYIIAHNYILAPVVKMFLPQMVSLEIPPDMWDLLKLGIGGYIVGRSGEKIVRGLKAGRE